MLRGYFDGGGPHLPPDFVQTRCAPVSAEGIPVMQGAPAKNPSYSTFRWITVRKNLGTEKTPKT